MSDTYYQSKAHDDARLQLVYGRDGIVTRKRKGDRKQVDSSRPLQADPSGTGIGGERRKRKIDSYVDDAS